MTRTYLVVGLVWWGAVPSAGATPSQLKAVANRDPVIERTAAMLNAIKQAKVQVTHFGGFLRIRSSWDVEGDGAPEETYEFRTDARLETHLKVGDYVTGLLSSHVELDYGLNRDDFHPEEQRFKLFEGYADVVLGSVDVRLGRQVIRWGKGDEVNPIDNFTPENLKEFINLERADRKLPVLASYLKYFMTDETSWEGIWIPFFQENLVAESDQDWEWFFRKAYRENPGATVFPESRPGRQFENSVWATRLVHQGSWGDASLSYAYHFEQNPTYEVRRNLPLSFVDTVWKREHSVGTDFELAHEGWGVRGELVYTTGKPFVTLNLSDDNLVEEKDTVQSVVGVDYTYRSNTYMNLQLVQQFIPNHDSGLDPRAYESSVTYRLWKKFFREKVKLQFSGQHFLTDGDFYYKADATYALRDGLDLNAGLFIFEGESDGLFGQFDKNDQLVVSMKYSF